jgi:hypothetical protein
LRWVEWQHHFSEVRRSATPPNGMTICFTRFMGIGCSTDGFVDQ